MTSLFISIKAFKYYFLFGKTGFSFFQFSLYTYIGKKNVSRRTFVIRVVIFTLLNNSYVVFFFFTFINETLRGLLKCLKQYRDVLEVNLTLRGFSWTFKLEIYHSLLPRFIQFPFQILLISFKVSSIERLSVSS